MWHHFASGLDDYPRGLQSDERDENVDLLGWMSTAARVMADYARLSGDAPGAARYEADAARWVAVLERHWDERAGAFCEVAVAAFGSASPSPEPEPGAPAPSPPYHLPNAQMGLVCHIGYVAIMPLLFRMLPADSPRLGRLMDIMADPAHLASPYGLRALSASDPEYGVVLDFSEDYWRSSVWVNMNYLAVAALRYYADVPGPHALRARELGAQLSENVTRLVVDEYHRTGFIWEHYRSTDGVGRGTHPFTGWSALIALLVADQHPL